MDLKKKTLLQNFTRVVVVVVEVADDVVLVVVVDVFSEVLVVVVDVVSDAGLSG